MIVMVFICLGEYDAIAGDINMGRATQNHHVGDDSFQFHHKGNKFSQTALCSMLYIPVRLETHGSGVTEVSC